MIQEGLDRRRLDSSVDELEPAMGLSGISKSTVSKLCVRHGSRTDGDAWLTIDERVGEFLNRPLSGDWPHVWLYATHLKVRQGGRAAIGARTSGATKSALGRGDEAVAVNLDGRRESEPVIRH